jgi:hypothetical protein
MRKLNVPTDVLDDRISDVEGTAIASEATTFDAFYVQ